VDAADQQEVEKTRYILDDGAASLLSHCLQVAASRPLRLLKTLGFTLKIGWHSDRGVLLNLAYLAEACVLLQWLREAGVSHIHTHFGTNSATVAMLCHLLGGPPYSITVHGPEEFDKPEAIALASKIYYAAFVVAVCSFGKSQLYRWCDYTQWEKIQLVRCGLDDLFLNHPDVPMPTEPRLVCVARLSEQKGHLLLLDAASQLVSEGLSFKLTLVGDGPLRNQLETLIQALNLENYVEITGWATNAVVQQHILSAQAIVAPSFAEGLPVVIMEALALARPVLSTYIAGIPELVQPGKNGWLVPAGSVAELASAMRTTLQTPVEVLAEMGKAGRTFVRQNHNVAVEGAKLVSLIKKYRPE
jgi:glycosyltransferase involved in cell wall biosynthesis